MLGDAVAKQALERLGAAELTYVGGASRRRREARRRRQQRAGLSIGIAVTAITAAAAFAVVLLVITVGTST